MPGDFPGGKGFKGFIETLSGRLHALAQERAENKKNSDFVMPIGIFLVLDKRNGGDVTAEELVRRFHLLHVESHKAIDFYFLGWQWRDNWDHSKGIVFNLDSFQKC